MSLNQPRYTTTVNEPSMLESLKFYCVRMKVLSVLYVLNFYVRKVCLEFYLPPESMKVEHSPLKFASPLSLLHFF